MLKMGFVTTGFTVEVGEAVTALHARVYVSDRNLP